MSPFTNDALFVLFSVRQSQIKLGLKPLKETNLGLSQTCFDRSKGRH